MNENFINFYPTPDELLDKIFYSISDTVKMKRKAYQSILEPSAGKGNIADYLRNRLYKETEIDCVEINEELRDTLKGKGYPVVAKDFLSFETFKHYDLIIMNPPFDNGAKHLLKAIQMQQKAGGDIICILNAETLRNLYTNERKYLHSQLEKYEADITYMQQMFSSAERSTDVEIAVIRLSIQAPEMPSLFLENMKKAYLKQEQMEKDVTDVAENDYIKSAVKMFEIETAAGLSLIREYKAMKPYILNGVKAADDGFDYRRPILELKLGNHDVSENGYLKATRRKYWEALFKDKRFTAAMTADMYSHYSTQIEELSNYDFNYSNILDIQVQIVNSLIEGIEETIMRLFDELSYQHSWYKECTNNIHYYNGWATNKAWYINKKVVLPLYVYNNTFKRFEFGYRAAEKLMDIEKAFDYLNGTPGTHSFLPETLRAAEMQEITKNIECRYFTLTFYKKGTVHIVFKDMELLKKLNIFGGKSKNMLPPSYGEVKYEDMTPQEQAVVNEFDGGKENYNHIVENSSQFLYEAKNAVPLLEKAV